jgi:hypothetical protein
MGIIANLDRALGQGARKLACTQGAITGTGGIATGLSAIDTGGNFAAGSAGAGAVACCMNSATTTPTNLATITSISAGTVNIAVVAAASGGNTISGVAANVNVLAVGR